MRVSGTQVICRGTRGHKLVETDIFDEFERVRETLILPIFGGENIGKPLSTLPNSLLEQYLLDPPLEIDFDHYAYMWYSLVRREVIYRRRKRLVL